MLTIIRGLPGSGKSTVAQSLAASTGCKVFEADDFFYNEEGEYIFDPSQLKDAHGACQDNARNALSNGESVIISNTFTCAWEAQFYFNLTKEFGVPFNVIECRGSFGSIHGVPQEAIDRMRDRWEDHNTFMENLGK